MKNEQLNGPYALHSKRKTVRVKGTHARCVQISSYPTQHVFKYEIMGRGSLSNRNALDRNPKKNERKFYIMKSNGVPWFSVSQTSTNTNYIL